MGGEGVSGRGGGGGSEREGRGGTRGSPLITKLSNCRRGVAAIVIGVDSSLLFF